MILADSSGIIAAVLPRDRWHRRVADFLASTPGSVVSPICHARGDSAFPGNAIHCGFRSRIPVAVGEGHFPVIEAIAADYRRAADLLEQYADFPLGSVDALVAALAERLNVSTILTLDRLHFGAVRPAHRGSFTLVP